MTTSGGASRAPADPAGRRDRLRPPRRHRLQKEIVVSATAKQWLSLSLLSLMALASVALGGAQAILN